MNRAFNLIICLILMVATPALATVNSSTATVSYNCNGVTTSFTYPFQVLEDDDILAIKKATDGTQTTLTLNSNYTVTGAGNDAGGTVVLSAGSVCASGYTLKIMRQMDLLQETDYVDGDAFSAESFEDALDKQTLILQELDERADRSVAFPKTGTAIGNEVDGVEFVNRANKTIGFDVDGDLALLPTSLTAEVLADAYYINISDAPYSNSLTTLVSELGGTVADVLVDATVTTSAITTVPSNLRLHVTKKGRINNSHLVTFNGDVSMEGGYFNGTGDITINGPFSAPLTHIFTGSGAVTGTGLKEAYPEWWAVNTTPGTTDMTAAVEAAINAVVGQSGKVVLSAMYGVDGVELQSNLTIEGARGTGFRRINGSTLYALENSSVDSKDNITLRGFDINGNKANCTAGGGVIFGGKNITVDGLYVYNTPTAAIESSPRTGDGNHRIINNYILNPATASNGWGGIGATSGTNVLIMGNTIESTDAYATYGIDVEPANAGDVMGNVLIANNILRGNRLYVDGANMTLPLTGVVVQGNFIDARGSKVTGQSNDAPVFLRHLDQLSFRNNETRSLETGSNVILGMVIDNVTNFDISGNTLTGFALAGDGDRMIYFANDIGISDVGRVSDNYFINSNAGVQTIRHGIHAYDATYATNITAFNNRGAVTYDQVGDPDSEIGPAKIITTIQAYDWGTINNAALGYHDFTVTGVTLYDLARVAFSADVSDGIRVTANATATDTVTVTVANNSGLAWTPGSLNHRIEVNHYNISPTLGEH